MTTQAETAALKAGDNATVFNSTIGGRPVIEGRATLVEQLDEDFWSVQFEGDPKDVLYDRIVDAEVQADPEAHLRALRDAYAQMLARS